VSKIALPYGSRAANKSKPAEPSVACMGVFAFGSTSLTHRVYTACHLTLKEITVHLLTCYHFKLLATHVQAERKKNFALVSML
jgi:hypothetical protein